MNSGCEKLPLVPVCTQRWWHDLKSLLLLEKLVLNYTTLLTLAASSTCTTHKQLCSSQQCSWHWTRAQLSHHMGMLICRHDHIPCTTRLQSLTSIRPAVEICRIDVAKASSRSIVNRGFITLFPNPLRISDSYCSSYYSVLCRDDYSLYLNAWKKMKAKLAPAINQGTLFKSKQMQLTEKLVRCQFEWHLQLQFWVTPSLYGCAKASRDCDVHSVLPTKSCLSSKHDKLLQHLRCKGSVPEA